MRNISFCGRLYGRCLHRIFFHCSWDRIWDRAIQLGGNREVSILLMVRLLATEAQEKGDVKFSEAITYGGEAGLPPSPLLREPVDAINLRTLVDPACRGTVPAPNRSQPLPKHRRLSLRMLPAGFPTTKRPFLLSPFLQQTCRYFFILKQNTDFDLIFPQVKFYSISLQPSTLTIPPLHLSEETPNPHLWLNKFGLLHTA